MSALYETAKRTAVQFLTAFPPGDITPEAIATQVDACCRFVCQQTGGSFRPDEIERLKKELEVHFSAWIGKPRVLEDRKGHEAWFATRRQEIDWRFWDRYRIHLESGSWSEASVCSVEQVTDEVLSRLEDPNRPGPWDRRGLVVGDVQSGKTANYTALIAKAVDAGYELIVVLAGMHNNLRSQTQARLDEGFLGYTSSPDTEKEAIGVGLIRTDLVADTVTTRVDSGDFNRQVAQHFHISPGRRPLLFVVKKNARVLANLVKWVRGYASSLDSETGRHYVKDVPILVIDDEADNASVDISPEPVDEYGQPDLDHDPRRINSLVRQILHLFDRSAYVGYTATPFANIFIHELGRTVKEGEDLFPRSFIISLPSPSNYVGPTRVFGITRDSELGLDEVEPLRLIVPNEDGNAWVVPRHSKELVPRYSAECELPPSLREALQAFILSGAAKEARGLSERHHSMLVHVTRYLAVQRRVHDQVKAYFEQLRMAIRYGENEADSGVMRKLHELWERDFVGTTHRILEQLDGEDPLIRELQWDEVQPHLRRFVDLVELRLVNGEAREALEYEEHADTGFKVIAIGGDKLSRGLTLEGLTISYFLRASRMYDTLMQMGRWFGYRPGYLDLCRLYIPDELKEWYEHITEASEELRQEFELMAATNATPKEYGLKVRSHPTLLVTSQVKMRAGVPLRLSFAESVSETTVFDGRDEPARSNYAAVAELIAGLGKPSARLRGRRPATNAQKATSVWRDLGPESILDFLSHYHTNKLAYRANTDLLRRYIGAQNRNGELIRWTVALISNNKGRLFDGIPGAGVGLVKRATGGRSEPGNVDISKLGIRRLVSPLDEAIDLSDEEFEAALGKTQSRPDNEDKKIARPDGNSIRTSRPSERGLLLLYPLDPGRIGEHGVAKAQDIPLMGMAISFPNSPHATLVGYVATHVYLDLIGADE